MNTDEIKLKVIIFTFFIFYIITLFGIKKGKSKQIVTLKNNFLLVIFFSSNQLSIK